MSKNSWSNLYTTLLCERLIGHIVYILSAKAFSCETATIQWSMHCKVDEIARGTNHPVLPDACFQNF